MDTHFFAMRMKPEIYKWFEKYSRANDLSMSKAVHQALIEFMGKTEAINDATEKENIEILKSRIGDIFKFKQTDTGFTFERVIPTIVELGGKERGKGDARESKTA